MHNEIIWFSQSFNIFQGMKCKLMQVYSKQSQQAVPKGWMEQSAPWYWQTPVSEFRKMQSSLFIGWWDPSYQGVNSTNSCDSIIWNKACAEQFRSYEDDGEVDPILKYPGKYWKGSMNKVVFKMNLKLWVGLGWVNICEEKRENSQ